MTNHAGALKMRMQIALVLASTLILSACGSSEASTAGAGDPTLDASTIAHAAADEAAKADAIAKAQEYATPSRVSEVKSSDVVEAENTVKLIINLNHRLCAEVVNVRPASVSTYHVKCIKNIGGRTTIDYLVNGENNTVVRI